MELGAGEGSAPAIVASVGHPGDQLASADVGEGPVLELDGRASYIQAPEDLLRCHVIAKVKSIGGLLILLSLNSRLG